MRLLVDLKPMDPALGLAVEEVMLDSARRGGCETIRIWVNDRAVILGRSQSVGAEADEEQAREFRIPILRRVSGGGTVYHYPGNLNVSIVLRKRTEISEVSAAFRFFGHLLAKSLAGLTPKLSSEGNGLYADGLKVGGAAQARRGDTILYHTTLLLQPPLIPMEKLLLAMRPGYCFEGVASRPGLTTSLSELLARPVESSEVVGPIIDALASALCVHLETEQLGPQETTRAAVLRDEKYGSPEWNRKF